MLSSLLGIPFPLPFPLLPASLLSTMGLLRFEVLSFLFLEGLLLLASGALALMYPDTFLQQLSLNALSPQAQINTLIQLIGATAIAVAVLIWALLAADNASAADFAFPRLVFIDAFFAYIVYHIAPAAVHAWEPKAVIGVGIAVAVALFRFYYGYIAGVAIPHASVVTALRPAAPAAPAAAPAKATVAGTVPTDAAAATATVAVSPKTATRTPKSPSSTRARRTTQK